MVSKLTEEDIKSVAHLHRQELKGFLPELGSDFLELLYRTSLEMPEMFTFTAKEDDKTTGFVSSIISTKGLYKKILYRHPIHVVMILLNHFITHPLNIIKFAKILTYPGFFENNAELLSIAVSDGHRLKGIGKRLFYSAVAEFKKRGINKFKISVYDRLAANGFYRKIGCRQISSFNFLGERMNYYEYKI